MQKHPWVLVAGGFHRKGGMDKANLALAEVLLEGGSKVHLVAHEITPELKEHPNVTAHVVQRPAGSILIGEQLLDYRGRSVAKRTLAENPQTRVVVNGGNCAWADINWVHCVHHAWNCVDKTAPAWFRIKNRLMKWSARNREWSMLRQSRLVIANSRRTRNDLVRLIGVREDRIHTVYLGAESDWQPLTDFERQESRRAFGLPVDKPLAVFVGALSHDNNKGFDTLWAAWTQLCREPDWNAYLVVAGAGSGVSAWQRRSREAGLGDRVRFLGFSERIRDLVGAADVLVSPVRYEAYGLNIQEAICLGTPAIVSATAGVAERYSKNTEAMLLSDPNDASELANCLRLWRERGPDWKREFAELGRELRRYGWKDMARQMTIIIDNRQAMNQVRASL